MKKGSEFLDKRVRLAKVGAEQGEYSKRYVGFKLDCAHIAKPGMVIIVGGGAGDLGFDVVCEDCFLSAESTYEEHEIFGGEEV